LLLHASGAELMAGGIEIDGAPDSSAHLLLLQKSTP
jgi:hypothetical protein